MILSIAELLGALAAGVTLLLLVWHKPAWGALAAISIASLLDCFEIATPGDRATAGTSINIYGDDVACVLLMLTCLLLVLRYPKGLSRDQLPCLLLLGLILAAFGRGFASFGPKQAGNNVRNLLTFVMPAITIMLLRPVIRLDAGRLARWLSVAGAVLSAIAVLRWMGVLAIPEQYVILDQKQLREVVRALPSDFAIFIAQAFIAAIYLLIADRRRAWWCWAAAALFGVVTLALQHRSVWGAAIAGLLWLAVRTGRISPVRWLALGAAALVALGLLLVADPAILQTAHDLITNNMTEAESKNSTWAWRVDGYTEAADRVLDSSPLDMVIGPPAGWIATTGGSFASIHIHSRYVDTFANYGFLGSLLLLVWFAVLIFRCRRRRTSSSPQALSRGPRSLLQALLISEVIYLVPYFGGLLQGAILGLVWVGATQRPSQLVSRCLSPMAARTRHVAEPAVVGIQR